MAYTRFGLDGYGVRRAGDFSGRSPVVDPGGPHPVSRLTRFALDGYGARRNGSFADKGGVVVVTPTIGDIRPALRAYLLDDATIASEVSTRIYPVRLPQGQRNPSIVYQRITEQSGITNDGADGLARARFQIDAWAKTQDGATELANAIKVRLDGARGDWAYIDDGEDFSVTVQGVFFQQTRDGYDPDVNLYRVSRDYFIWYNER